jgi:hypothetical protein
MRAFFERRPNSEHPIFRVQDNAVFRPNRASDQGGNTDAATLGSRIRSAFFL